jgi:hypothetical protein
MRRATVLPMLDPVIRATLLSTVCSLLMAISHCIVDMVRSAAVVAIECCRL